jgi:hypothetical protein
MRRFLSSLFVSAALLALSGPVFAADSMGAMDKSKLKCAKGEVAVSGSMKKDGSMQKAYCRKAPSKMAPTTATKMTSKEPAKK